MKTLQQKLIPSNKKLSPLLSTPKPPLLPTPQFSSRLPSRTSFFKLNNKPNNNQNSNQPRNTRIRPIADFDDKISKGLCFWCDEKYVPGHNCRNKQLYVLEVSEDIGLENVEGAGVEEVVETEEEDSNPHISVHAINGIASKGYQTMRVTV